MSGIGSPRTGFGLIPVLFGTLIHAADTEPFDLSLLNTQPATATTRFGTDLGGNIVDIRENLLAIRNTVDGGEVIYSVARSDIASITLPGEALVDYAQRMWNEGNRKLMIPVKEALKHNDEAIILDHVDLQLYADARDLVHNWIKEARRFGKSVLGR